jgi:pimeloyl-ACP methyl ester carboxylesterase
MKQHTKLIILPGWGGSRETWKTFVDIAAQKYDVTVINLPCFGDEPCPKIVWGVEEYSEFVASKVKDTASQTILLGHSFGGQVAAYLAARHPTICDKLILSGAPVYRPKKSIRRVIFWVVAKLGKIIFKLPIIERFDLWAKKILYRAADSPDYAKTSGIKQSIFKKIVRQDVSAELERITQPTLVVWGENDTYVPLRMGKKISREITGASFKVIPGGRHGLHLDHTERFFDIVDRFISS